MSDERSSGTSDYVTRGQRSIPVQDDDAPVEDPIDESKADSDQQLERDDREAIDKSNMMNQRTRGAKPEGSYKEPSDNAPELGS
ncbi:hypothetical protein MY4038_006340 [Beauveria bassiana]|uniref:Histone chaperone domain-containing protein n=1 Tax=Beauveria bassiana (strain ARSEF 2860) TaxID=655819 RepID=J5K704_BEAB2|nr:uncharacterized protein BBA_00750 [Beauveria bassiana ARSEF 2860]EJP69881.1 hypothetical protein BBA_00750 [Beauveria bassiana ARSEF 2860]KAF1730765.1 hypothetical protein CRV24_008835 [Beauveria bassiana]KAH8715193.1 hypothetical protein HC256_004043 [Beauveria bassiana]